MVWSPPSCSTWRRQSIHANAPSSTGEPVPGAGDQPTPVNLSAPRAAKARHTASWPSSRMFTQKPSASRMRAQLVDELAGQKRTSGGSSDNEVNDCTVRPAGSPSAMAVTTATPLQKWPRTWRKRAVSISLTHAMLSERKRHAFVGGGDLVDPEACAGATGTFEQA